MSYSLRASNTDTHGTALEMLFQESQKGKEKVTEFMILKTRNWEESSI
jgi:hypothetical protein